MLFKNKKLKQFVISYKSGASSTTNNVLSFSIRDTIVSGIKYISYTCIIEKGKYPVEIHTKIDVNKLSSATLYSGNDVLYSYVV